MDVGECCVEGPASASIDITQCSRVHVKLLLKVNRYPLTILVSKHVGIHHLYYLLLLIVRLGV